MKSPLYLPTFLLAISMVISSCLSAHALGQVAVSSPGEPSGATVSKQAKPASSSAGVLVIPGPLRSFQRMAAISQKSSSEEVLPLLARQVFSEGYRSGKPTEYLILLSRYVNQARELTTLAGASATIRVSNCDEARTLLPILGYRFGRECGQ